MIIEEKREDELVKAVNMTSITVLFQSHVQNFLASISWIRPTRILYQVIRT